jgi:hypothetical protein
MEENQVRIVVHCTVDRSQIVEAGGSHVCLKCNRRMIDASTASAEAISEAITRGGKHTCGFITGARAAALAAAVVLAGCEKKPHPVGEIHPMGTVALSTPDRVEEIAGRDFPTAEFVGDSGGWVLSPYSGRRVRVYGIPAGELVNDPEFPMQEENYFRVPELPVPPVEDAK